MGRQSDNKAVKEQIIQEILETEGKQTGLEKTHDKFRQDMAALEQGKSKSDAEAWKSTRAKMANVGKERELLREYRGHLVERLRHTLDREREARLKAIPNEVAALRAKKEEIWTRFVQVYAEACVLGWHLWGTDPKAGDIHRPFFGNHEGRLSFLARVEELQQDSDGSIRGQIEALVAEEGSLGFKKITEEDVEGLIDQARAKDPEDSRATPTPL